MKKPALIIGKKQIIMACLTSILAIAVYVNYVISDTDRDNGMMVENMTQSEDYGGICKYRRFGAGIAR